MRDGKYLAGTALLPRASDAPHPVVLIQTPFGRERLTVTRETRPNALLSDTDYAFVVTDWRGKFGSKEASVKGVDPDLGKDGYDTVRWIAEQGWCDGNIGSWGPSALGMAQFETASEHPPNYVCAVPTVMPLNLGYNDFFPGGVLLESWVKLLAKLGWGDVYGQMVANPINDERWHEAESDFVVPEDMRIPMLLISGWCDIYTDAVIETFDLIRRRGGPEARDHSRLIMGPWCHSTIDREQQGDLRFPAAADFAARRTVAFFDCWLRGKDTACTENEPAITYYQMGADEWRSAEAWPPKDVVDRPYYLHSRGALSTELPADDVEPSVFSYDPSDPVPTLGGQVLDPVLQPGPRDQRETVESREDVLVFSTATLEEPVSVTGKVEVKLYVSSDRRDTDFTAILTDVYPDGRSMLVGRGIRRMRFRNSTSRQELIEPGEVYLVTVDLPSTAVTFRTGHRIRVTVSSSSYPQYAVNLNDGGEMYRPGKGLVATNSVHHTAERPSALVLPIAAR
jgi:predicted acyl esterase